MIETVISLAGERMPHGTPVRFRGRACFLERDDRRVEGVTKRPPQTFATHHEKGQPVTVQIDGGIRAERDGVLRWVELHNRRIVDA